MADQPNGRPSKKPVPAATNHDEDSPHVVKGAELHTHLKAGAQHPRNEKSPLKGYDCSRPTHIYPTTYAASGPCVERHSVKTMRNATYQLLQLETKEKIMGHVCKILDTRTVVACNNHDYMTLRPDHSYSALPIKVDIDVCRDMVQTGFYIDPKGKQHKVLRNGVTAVNYLEKGRTWSNQGWDTGESECEGEDWTNHGDFMADVVVAHLLKIVIEEEIIVRRDDDVIAHRTGLTLDCAWTTGACRTTFGTYLWKPNTGFCPLAVTRQIVSGYKVEDERGDTMFISNDKSLVRVILTGTTIMCDRMVEMTNYEGLYLYPKNQPKQFDRKIDPSEGRLSMYVQNRDEFLFHHVLEQVEREMNAYLANNCRNQARRNRVDFFLRRMQPGLVTFALGNGTFATGAGDTLFRYHCSPMLVVAQETAECYDSLPVRAYRGDQGVDTSSPLRFLQPLTHRLSPRASIVPCSRHFGARYQAANGAWIAPNPTIHITEDPIQLQNEDEQYKFDFEFNTDWSQGGIYSNEDLKRIEQYLEYPKLVDSIGSGAAASWSKILPYNPYQLDRVYPHSPPISWLSQSLQDLDDWFASFGRWASIAVAVYIIGSLAWNLFDLLFRCIWQTKHGGCNRLLLLTLCPSFLLDREYARDVIAKATNTTNADIDAEQGRRSRPPTREPSPEPGHQGYRHVNRDDYAYDHEDLETEDFPPHRHRSRSRSRTRTSGRRPPYRDRSESRSPRDRRRERGRSAHRQAARALGRISRSASRTAGTAARIGRDAVRLGAVHVRRRSRSALRAAQSHAQRGYERARSASRDRVTAFANMCSKKLQDTFGRKPVTFTPDTRGERKPEARRDHAFLQNRPETPGLHLRDDLTDTSTGISSGGTTKKYDLKYDKKKVYGMPPEYNAVAQPSQTYRGLAQPEPEFLPRPTGPVPPPAAAAAAARPAAATAPPPSGTDTSHPRSPIRPAYPTMPSFALSTATTPSTVVATSNQAIPDVTTTDIGMTSASTTP